MAALRSSIRIERSAVTHDPSSAPSIAGRGHPGPHRDRRDGIHRWRPRISVGASCAWRTTTNATNSAFDGFKTVMSMTAIVLAFCLVQANGNLREVDATVAKEAAAISIADRALLRFGKPEAIALRSVLADYGAAVVDEWPSLARRERSQAADAAYTALSKKTRAMAPDEARQEAMYHELLKDLDDLSDLREDTLTESDYRLPTIFWVTAVCPSGSRCSRSPLRPPAASAAPSASERRRRRSRFCWPSSSSSTCRSRAKPA